MFLLLSTVLILFTIFFLATFFGFNDRLSSSSGKSLKLRFTNTQTFDIASTEEIANQLDSISYFDSKYFEGLPSSLNVLTEGNYIVEIYLRANYVQGNLSIITVFTSLPSDKIWYVYIPFPALTPINDSIEQFVKIAFAVHLPKVDNLSLSITLQGPPDIASDIEPGHFIFSIY